MNESHARAAAEAGVMVLIDSDAHSAPRRSTNVRYGIATARRAWLTRRSGRQHARVEGLRAAAQAGARMKVLDGRLSVCRLPASDRVPSWALELHEGFVSITRTPDELSIVCPEEAVPPDTTVEDGFRAMVLPGPIPFTETGVLASLAVPLAAAGISIFAVSTYDTDYVLVQESELERALSVLGGGVQRISSGSPFEPVIGFSRAVRVGDRVLVSGTGPVMADGGCPASTYEQARAAGRSCGSPSRRPGASVSDVVRTRTFLTPAADPDGAMRAHGEQFADVRPASTMLSVHSLLDARWHVEVEAEAQI